MARKPFSRKVVNKRTGATTYKVQNLNRKVNKIMRTIETKRHDIVGSGTMAFNNTNVYNLTQVAAGTSDLTRVGSKLSPTYLRLKAFLTSHPTSSEPTVVRATVVRCKGRYVPDTAVGSSSATGLYEYGGTLDAALATFAFDNRRHFTVVHDKMITLNIDSGEGNASAKIMDLSKKLGGVLEFTDATTSYEGGGLYLCLTSTLDSASSPPSIQFQSSIWYKDA